MNVCKFCRLLLKLWFPRDGALNDRFGLFVPRLELLNPRFPLLLLNPRFALPLFNPRFAPALDVNPRDSFPRPEAGGVKVCQPGREDVIEPRVPPFVRALKPDDGRLNEFAPRFALNPFAAREVLVARFELKPPRAATEFPPEFPREAVKKCCEFDGAFRYEPGFAARPFGL